jgi:hypothetical protein
MGFSLKCKFQISIIKVYVFTQIAGKYDFKDAKNILDSILVQLIRCHIGRNDGPPLLGCALQDK